MVDREMLEAMMLGKRAVTTTGEAAESLGVPEDEAERRLEQLLQDGHVAKVVAMWGAGDTWDVAGYGISPRGRSAIEGDEV